MNVKTTMPRMQKWAVSVIASWIRDFSNQIWLLNHHSDLQEDLIVFYNTRQLLRWPDTANCKFWCQVGGVDIKKIKQYRLEILERLVV